MSAIQLAAIATSLLPNIHFTGTRDIEGTQDEFRYAVLTDADNQNYVVMVAKDQKYANKFTLEINNTQILAEHFAVPKIITHNDRMAIYQPYSGKSYDPSLLTPPQLKNLAKSLGTLHALPFSIIEQNGLPNWINQQNQRNLMDVLDEAIATGQLPGDLCSRFENILESTEIWGYESTVINGELKDTSIVFLEDTVHYVLNWSALKFSDPALDMAFILPKLSESSLKVFLSEYNKTRRKINKHYVPDEFLDERAEFYADFNLVSDYLKAKNSGDEAKTAEALEKLNLLDKKLHLDDELRQAEIDSLRQAEDAQIKEKEREISDSNPTERLDLGQADAINSSLSLTSPIDISNNEPHNTSASLPTQAVLSPAEQEMVNMLNNSSGKVSLRHQPSVNQSERKKNALNTTGEIDLTPAPQNNANSGKFSLANYTGEVGSDDNTANSNLS